MSTTPAPSSSPTTSGGSITDIYKSGDLMLQNPAESGIIFVSVILVSAFLEWVLQKASNIENKYARMMVETMSQEVTIVGVLALLLMFGTSVIPAGMVDAKYITLFTWANMSLFFMAFFFVATVLFLFAWANFDIKRWRTFEEGKMDSEEEEAMSYREKLFKRAAEKYAHELKVKFEMKASEVPFFEFLNIMVRKQLVRISNLSYRTWLWLSVIVVANLARAKATPFLKRGEETTFSNAVMFIGVIGWGTLFAFLIFFTILQRRFFLYVNNRLSYKVANASFLIPLGGAKRALEFIQVIAMNLNWYVTLFVTGLGKEASTLRGWRAGTVVSTFVLPILIVGTLLPWTIMSIAILGALGGLNRNDMERIRKKVRGEIAESDEDEGSDSDSDDDEAETAKGTATGTRLTRRGSEGNMSSRSGGSNRAAARPGWLEVDDDWDGKRTREYGEAKSGKEASSMYYRNVDRSTLAKLLRGKDSSSPQQQQQVRPLPAERRAAPGRQPWEDSDEDDDIY